MSSVRYAPMVKATGAPDLTTQAGRLRYARALRYSSMRGAANAHGWNENTYKSHELGIRRDGALPEEDARKYARAFGVSPQWLLTGRGKPDADQPADNTVPLVGKVGAGNAAHFYASADPTNERVEAPRDATPQTRAARIVGPSLGQHMEGWLVFFGEQRPQVPQEWLGQLCVVGLVDDRILVKWVRPGGGPGFYHLESTAEATMFDEEVVWSALVTDMRPR